jgi:hypothetical protein
MANVFAPFGFRQNNGTGSAPTYEQVTQVAGIDYATANIFFGDPVFRLTTGNVGTLAGVTTGPGPSTTPIAGVFVGCKYLSTSQKRTLWSNYWPGSDVTSTNMAVTESYIINDPNAQFLAQAGPASNTTGLTLAQVGLNVQFAYGAGNPATGISGAYIDLGTPPATTSTLPFRVVQLVGAYSFLPAVFGSTQTGAYNFAVVAFNNVETKTLTAV